jgi:biotin-dependent carboxylase-like uncharacterized protein
MSGPTDWRVLGAGTLTTIQDRGRPGHAHLGVPRAGVLDPPAAALANRLVGNDEAAAVLEVTLGGLEIRAGSGRWVAVTGAAGPVSVDEQARGHARAEWVPAGATLRVGTPVTGVRSYVAIAGGIVVRPVLGSRSTDTLAWVGPPRLEAGATLPVGEPTGEPRPLDTPRPPRVGSLRMAVGPRDDWFAAGAVNLLYGTAYTVHADSNRIGLRLSGPKLERARSGELASEGMVLGAVQVPPSGQPVVFLADHPVTGGYPVIGVVDLDDLWQCAQLRPGDEVRFTPSPGPVRPDARR